MRLAEPIDVGELRPGTVVRVGLHASGPIGHTFYLRVTSNPEQLPDGRIRVTGDRLTRYGRAMERLTLRVPIDQLYPAVMT